MSLVIYERAPWVTWTVMFGIHLSLWQKYGDSSSGFPRWILNRSFVWLAEVLGWKLAGRNHLYDSMAVSRDNIFLILRYWSTGPFILQLSTSPPCLRRLEKWLCLWTTGGLAHTVGAEERTTPWRSKSLHTSWRTKLNPWDVTFSPIMDLCISAPTSTSGGHYKREYIIIEKMRFTDSTSHEIHLWSYRSSLLFFFLLFFLCFFLLLFLFFFSLLFSSSFFLLFLYPALSLTHSVESSQNSFCPTLFLPSFLSIWVRAWSCVQQRVRGWVWHARCTFVDHGADVFTCTAQGMDVRLRPWHRAHSGQYSIYAHSIERTVLYICTTA